MFIYLCSWSQGENKFCVLRLYFWRKIPGSRHDCVFRAQVAQFVLVHSRQADRLFKDFCLETKVVKVNLKKPNCGLKYQNSELKGSETLCGVAGELRSHDLNSWFIILDDPFHNRAQPQLWAVLTFTLVAVETMNYRRVTFLLKILGNKWAT